MSISNFRISCNDIALSLATGISGFPCAKRHWSRVSFDAKGLFHGLIAVLETIPVIGLVIALAETFFSWVCGYKRIQTPNDQRDSLKIETDSVPATPLLDAEVSVAPPVSGESFGESWLQACAPENSINPVRCVANELYKACETKNRWDLAFHFPQRTITKEMVSGWKIPDILKLTPAKFLAISDLLSVEQCTTLIQIRGLSEGLKQAIYFYNAEFGEALFSR